MVSNFNSEWNSNEKSLKASALFKESLMLVQKTRTHVVYC